MRRLGMTTALAVVVGIIVLLIVAMAVIGVSTGSISQLAKKAGEVISGTSPAGAACGSYNSQASCVANPMCEWKDEKCAPKSVGGER